MSSQTPAETAIQALLTGLFVRLRGHATWSDRVYLNLAPADVTEPYVMVVIQSGGETNFRTKVDADFQVQVRCVHPDISMALTGQRALNALLNDCGEQDDPADFVNAGAVWTITTITKGENLFITEQRPDNRQRIHAGDVYSIVMEQR
ncbi:MAG: hypothetical protein ACPG7F_00700 [Aggregatilineales bacterium]